MLIEEKRKIVCVDTNIWHFAYTAPKEKEFIDAHKEAKNFLFELLKDTSCQIAISTYQIGEIIEMFRKERLNEEFRRKFLQNFFSEKFLIKELTPSTIKLCADLSISSNIHIYDYLVAIPLKGIITRIYSADDHFQHQDFKEIAEVINPISPWTLTEGRRPKKEDERY